VTNSSGTYLIYGTDSTKYLLAGDVVYTTVDTTVLCTVDCICDANYTLWGSDAYITTSIPDPLDPTKNITTSKLKPQFEVTSMNPDDKKATIKIDSSDKFQECPAANVSGSKYDIIFSNITNNTKFGMDAVGAIEEDFSCAGFCTAAAFYSFSDVG